jgi:hypothetical protein
MMMPRPSPELVAALARVTPPYVLVAKRYLNPDAFDASLADAAAARVPDVAKIACATLDEAMAWTFPARAPARARAFVSRSGGSAACSRRSPVS